MREALACTTTCQNICSRHRSWRWTTPSTAPRLSVTITDVILCVSMIFSASTARSPRRIVIGLRRHRLAGGQRQDVGRTAHQAAQVSVGEDADEPAAGVGDGGHAEPLARHLVEDVRHRRRRLHDRRRGAAVHDVLDLHQPASELAGRMQRRELILAEPLADEERHRQRVAHREGGGRARRRHEVHRTGFLGDGAVERDVGGLGERRRGIAGDGDEPRAEAADRFEQPQQLLGLAAVRERNHHVVVADGAEIAVRGLGGVQEPGRRAGARQRGGDLPADDAGLAHAGDDDAAAAVEEELDGALEVAVDAVDEAEDGGGLGAEHLAREIEPGGGVGASCELSVRLSRTLLRRLDRLGRVRLQPDRCSIA